MPRKAPPDRWKNRIVGDADVDPATLLPNALNWRLHGTTQGAALTGVLTEVGWVQRILVNQRSGTLIDGHLRLKLALDRHEPTVPVLYVDLSDAEEHLVLATLDPLSAMAETDAGAFHALLDQVESGDAAVQALLSQLAEDAGLIPKVDPMPTPGEGDVETLETSYQILVSCADEEEQRDLLTRFTEEGLSCKALLL